jgi:hypothetical protein
MPNPERAEAGEEPQVLRHFFFPVGNSFSDYPFFHTLRILSEMKFFFFDGG